MPTIGLPPLQDQDGLKGPGDSSVWLMGTGNQFLNHYAFAALKGDGSVVTWGDSNYGGDSSTVSDQLRGGVEAIYSTVSAFAALKADGSVVTWGYSNGGDSGAVSDQLQGGVEAIYSTWTAFAALKADGSVVTWGAQQGGGNSGAVADQLQGGVEAIYSTERAFAALKADGSVVTWGDSNYGGDSSAVGDRLHGGVEAIYSNQEAFAALKADGSVVTWGDSNYGGDSSAVSDQLRGGVEAIYSTKDAFAALKADGSVVTWGDSFSGGDSSAVADQLQGGVKAIYSTLYGFAALKADGSVITWGFQNWGDPSAVSDQLQGGVEAIYFIQDTFVALKADGSVVTWGNSNYGDGSSAVSDQLQGGVEAIYSTRTTFAALKADGSVVTWGDSNYGGDSSAVSDQLQGGVEAIYSTWTAFAALKADGSVVTWGNSSRGGDSSAVADQLSSGVVGLASPFAELQSPLEADGDSETILDENFDDNVRNGLPWTYAYDVQEIGGQLQISQSVTDQYSTALYTFDQPIYDFDLSMDRYYHPENNYYFGSHRFTLVGADGQEVRVGYDLLRSAWGPDYDSVSQNFDSPRYYLYEDKPAGSSVRSFATDSTSSDFYDRWITSTVKLDSTSGTFTVDLDSNGSAEIVLTDAALVGAAVAEMSFNSYGWWTGHYSLMDNLLVTGNRSSGDVTEEVTNSLNFGFTGHADGGGTGWPHDGTWVADKPDDVLLALHMAVDSYSDDEQAAAPRPPVGWEILDEGNFATPVDARFQATAYRDTSSGDVVIAYQGSDDIAEIWNLSIPLGLGDPSARGYLQDSINYYESVQEMHEIPFSKIAFTGHSLGGIVAQYMSSVTGLKAMSFAGFPTNIIHEKLDPLVQKTVGFLNPSDTPDYSNIVNLRLAGELLGSTLSFVQAENFGVFITSLEVYAKINSFLDFAAGDLIQMSDQASEAQYHPDSTLIDVNHGIEIDAISPIQEVENRAEVHSAGVHAIDLYARNVLGSTDFETWPGFFDRIVSDGIATSASGSESSSLFSSLDVPSSDADGSLMGKLLALSQLGGANGDFPNADPVFVQLMETLESLMPPLVGAEFDRVNTSDLSSAVVGIGVEQAARALLDETVSVDDKRFEGLGITANNNGDWISLDLAKLNTSYGTFRPSAGFEDLVDLVFDQHGPTLADGSSFINTVVAPREFRDAFDEIERMVVGLDSAGDWSSKGDQTSTAVLVSGRGQEIETGDSNDILIGSDGNDVLKGWFGNNLFLGGRDSDVYHVHVGGGNVNRISDNGGFSDSLIIDGYVTDAWSDEGIGENGRNLNLEVNEGAGFVKIYDVGDVGEIENISDSGGPLPNFVQPQKTDGAWVHEVGATDGIVTAIEGAENVVKGNGNYLDNTTFYGFASDDTVIVEGFWPDQVLDYSHFESTRSSLIVDVDVDLDGVADVTFTFEGDYEGKDISLSSDGDGNTILRVTEQTPPIASDNSYATEASSEISGNVLLDGTPDSDPDGDALSLLRINGETLEALDTDLSMPGAQVRLASGATLSIATDGTFAYDPQDAFTHLGAAESAQDMFSYTVTDQRLDGTDTATVTFTINVENAPPVVAGETYSTDDGETLTIGAGLGLLANDSDPDAADTIFVQSFTAAGNGNLSVTTDGSFEYTPDPGFVGTETITYTVSDGTATEQGTLTIDVVNEAEPEFNMVTGTSGRDTLIGTDGNDLITSGGGVLDTLSGKGGADVFEFRDLIGNGARDVANVTDFDIDLDSLGLDADDIAASRSFAGNTYINLAGGENDLVVLQGLSSIDEISFA